MEVEHQLGGWGWWWSGAKRVVRCCRWPRSSCSCWKENGAEEGRSRRCKCSVYYITPLTPFIIKNIDAFNYLSLPVLIKQKQNLSWRHAKINHSQRNLAANRAHHFQQTCAVPFSPLHNRYASFFSAPPTGTTLVHLYPPTQHLDTAYHNNSRVPKACRNNPRLHRTVPLHLRPAPASPRVCVQS